LWSERGFDEVTVEEICAAAGVGRTTFYLHFENKEQLLSSLAWATALGVTSDLEGVRGTGTFDAQLDVFIRGLVRRVGSVPKPLAELVLRSQRVQLARLRAAGRLDDSTRFADILSDVLVEANDRGDVTESADAAELGEILGALTMDAIETWASSDSDAAHLAETLRSRFAVVIDQYRTTR
jgi:AcrR family transcriptional regulator